MPGLSDSFWGRSSGDARGEPRCHCGAALGEPVNLPDGDPRGRLAFRTCTGPEPHTVWLPHQPGAATATREAEAC